MSVHIKTTPEGDMRVKAPYLPSFPRAAREIGGDFDKFTKEWVFKAGAVEAVNDLVVRYYGTTGFDNPELCSVQVSLGSFSSQRRGLFALGRQIAGRNRTGKLVLGVGVRHVSGSLPGGPRSDDLI